MRSLATAVAAVPLAGGIGASVVSQAHGSSYASQILGPGKQNAVFYWVDAALQQIRDQRVLAPRAAYNLGLATAAAFLAANGIVKAYGEPFGIGNGPQDADPEVAYGVAFSLAAAEAFQQPFLFERTAFLKRFPGSEAKSLGVEWGRRAAMIVLGQRTDDGSEPSEVNYYLGRYERRGDTLQWSPTAPFYGASPGPSFPSFEPCRSGCIRSCRRISPVHEPWTQRGRGGRLWQYVA